MKFRREQRAHMILDRKDALHGREIVDTCFEHLKHSGLLK